MGKEWYYWGGGKTSKKGGGGGGGGREGEKHSANLPTGCMCAVFQLFDFHQFQFPLNHGQQSSNLLQPNSFLPLEDPPIPKGRSFYFSLSLFLSFFFVETLSNGVLF